MAAHWGRPVEQVFNWKETTWYENHTVRFRQSFQWESRVEPEIRSRSEALVSSLIIRLARGCKHWYPLAPGRRYGARRSSLSEYVSPSISQTYNKLLPPSKIKWERYIFIKKLFCFVNWISKIMFDYLADKSIKDNTTLPTNYCLTRFTCIVFLLYLNIYVFLSNLLCSPCLSLVSITTISIMNKTLGLFVA